MIWKRWKHDEKPRCSFCNKGEDITGELISSPRNDSPSVPPCYICNECVAACNSILDDRRHNQEDPGSARNTEEEPIVLDDDAPHVMPNWNIVSTELPREKVTIRIDATWVKIAHSPLYWIVGTLQGVSLSFAPLFLYESGKGFFRHGSEWIIVTSSYAVILVVGLFYSRLGGAVIRELRKQKEQ
jgi:hypothetical protein